MIEKCPFDRGEGKLWDDTDGFIVECQTCFASSGYANTAKDAIAAWNERAWKAAKLDFTKTGTRIRKIGPKCPQCDKQKMDLIYSRKTGSVFWGCGDFPECEGSSSLKGERVFDRMQDSGVAAIKQQLQDKHARFVGHRGGRRLAK